MDSVTSEHFLRYLPSFLLTMAARNLVCRWQKRLVLALLMSRTLQFWPGTKRHWVGSYVDPHSALCRFQKSNGRVDAVVAHDELDDEGRIGPLKLHLVDTILGRRHRSSGPTIAICSKHSRRKRIPHSPAVLSPDGTGNPRVREPACHITLIKGCVILQLLWYDQCISVATDPFHAAVEAAAHQGLHFGS